ncbi:hypothetical protein [Nonomuraea sp. NPDC050691]|uniref:hypothetical protein n=1 Tax=Nonomuraea sp. NPDC050691 TaxID=3155661 RepID=UPI0033DD07CD
MNSHDPKIYPGTFVTCVYNADRALCRPRQSPGTAPELADCRLLACRNTALTAANREALTPHVAELDASLAEPDLPAPYVRERLTAQRYETTAFLAPYHPETP